jgi:hypothetical protein
MIITGNIGPCNPINGAEGADMGFNCDALREGHSQRCGSDRLAKDSGIDDSANAEMVYTIGSGVSSCR